MIDLTVERRIAADHPAFAGHFPGRPLLPGVLLLAEVMEALRPHAGDRPVTIETAKFLSPVRPGDALQVHVQGEGTAWRFEVRNGDAVAATGRLTVGPQGPRAERRAAPKPARIPPGDRPTYSSDEGPT